MKLCSQCEFIYEDEQERCDMDGAELVYEPTLEHVFPRHALALEPESGRRAPARMVIPIAKLTQVAPAIPVNSVHPTSRRWLAQLAAAMMLAVVAFIAVFEGANLFKPKPNITAKTQSPNSESRRFATVGASVGGDNSETRNAKLETAAVSDALETRKAEPETIAATDKRKVDFSKPSAAAPALPGLKPLPQLKPLPTLKPLPRLADKTRSQNTNRTALIVNAKTGAKKDSRLGSFLKKTGRIFTKPFKS